jgi:GTPase-associated adaptor domain-containing protein
VSPAPALLEVFPKQTPVRLTSDPSRGCLLETASRNSHFWDRLYLGAHPHIAKEDDDATTKVRGVGKAICYFVAQVLKKENCPAVWGEATPLSANYYQAVFKLNKVEDLIFAPQANVIAFAEDLEQQWANEEINGMQPDDDIDKLEQENPPFVGTKAAVFSPQKRLAFRFLSLGYHRQMEIALVLRLAKPGGQALTRERLATEVFKNAREKGKLAQLWNLVSKAYGEANQEENPFAAEIVSKRE